MFERFKRKIQPIINIYHLFKAIAANLYYGFPSRSLKVVGVTGTDGKTTTAKLIYHILEKANKNVSVASTVYTKIGQKEYDTGLHMTTPDAFFVQKLLKKAVSQGSEYFVLETTSHALDQNRVFGIRFQIGVITNITHEHLDYHKTYLNYVRTKAKLLLRSTIKIINKDDRSYELLKRELDAKHKVLLTYSLKSEADFITNISEKIEKDLPEFNNYNFLAAYSVCKTIGVDDATIFEAIKTYELPSGRLETVYDKQFKIIIDFAHTPNSIHQVLKYIKIQLKPKGRIIHVFGSAGLRDKEKRPLMGEASATFADVIILTEEDYRTENPIDICREIAHGIEKKSLVLVESEDLDKTTKNAYSIIVDRYRAIQKALEIVSKDDLIILTGKSHEQSLARGTTEYPWNDKKSTLEILNNLKEI